MKSAPPLDNRRVAEGTFDEPGTYTLRCQASDGAVATVGDLTITVLATSGP